METLSVVFHIFVCLFLIGVILLQAGKGSDIGAVFGGASQTLFGGRGPTTFLNKLTIIISVIFFLSSVWLVKVGTNKGDASVIQKAPIEQLQPSPQIPNPEEKPVEK